ncbi:MAG: hypothetical protein WAQ22_02210 [Candidatus Saccharimonas sp.]
MKHRARHQKRQFSLTLMFWVALFAIGTAIGISPVALATPPSFDWNWEYPAPTCEAGVVVSYPVDLPAGQSNDANVRVKNMDTGDVQTFNFHNSTGTWSGVKSFDVTTHPNWPGWTHFEYQWVQIGGTNYHWQGSVECGGGDTPIPPEKPAVITMPVVDQRTTCELGVESRDGVKTTDWTLDGNTWVQSDPVTTWNDWSKVRDLTPSEKTELGCDKPVAPEPLTGEDVVEEAPVCTPGGTGGTVDVVMTAWHQDPVFDESTWEWTFGQKVYDDPIVVTQRAATDDECGAIITPTDPPSEKPTPVSPVQEKPATPVAKQSAPAAKVEAAAKPQLAKTGVARGVISLVAPLLASGTALLVSRRYWA